MAWDTHRRLLAWWIAPSLSFKAESCSERRGTTSWPTRHTSTSPTQPERSTQYYRERKRSYPDTHVSRRLKRRTGNLQRHWFKIRPLHTPFLFVCFLQSIAPAFFPLILRRHKGIISVLISGSNKAGVLSFLMRAFWITLSCKNLNYNFFPSTRSFAREVLLIALLLSCSHDCYVFATSRCLVRFGDSLLPIHYLCCVDTMGFLVINIGCPVIVTSELMFRGPKRAY